MPRLPHKVSVTGAIVPHRSSRFFGSFSAFFLSYLGAIFYPNRLDWA
jgi:hypothetical protein